MSILYEQVFSKSPEKAITAQKKRTRVLFYILEETTVTEISGTTVFVGTRIRLRGVLEWLGTDGVWRALCGKPIYYYHKVGAGAYAEVARTIPVCPEIYADFTYTLAEPGIHTFYAEFKGDAEYEGCSQKASLSARR